MFVEEKARLYSKRMKGTYPRQPPKKPAVENLVGDVAAMTGHRKILV